MLKKKNVNQCGESTKVSGNKLELFVYFSSDRDSGDIHIFDGTSGGKPMHTVSGLHSVPVVLMAVSMNWDKGYYNLSYFYHEVSTYLMIAVGDADAHFH